MSSSTSDLSADCYSGGDRAFMTWTQAIRARGLGWVLPFLTRIGIRADHVTAASLLSGMAFLPLWLLGAEGWALSALGLHVVLDGLDGPLARHAGSASARGSLTDTASDHVVVVASTVALVLTGTLSGALGAVYLVAYTLVLAFSMVRNALAIPYAWLVRPRFFVFAAIAAHALWSPLLELTVLVASVLLALKVASGFVRLRAHLGAVVVDAGE